MSTPYPNFGEPLLNKSSKSQRDKTKKRRWQSRSDEEIAEYMDDRNLPYRRGWPRLPPLPVSTVRNGACDLVNNPQSVIETVMVLCQAQNIHPFDIYFAFRAPKVQEPDEDYHTLVVTTDLSKNAMTYSLIIQIRKLLQQDPRHDEMSIEIIDHRVVNGLFSFAIPPSEEHLLGIWEKTFNITLEEICKRKERWTTIEMLHRGCENSVARCPATIVITSPTAAKDIWIRAILPDIHKRVLAVFPLTIELLCGSSLHIASQGKVPNVQLYGKVIQMGASIGQHGLGNHSDTAGGMVKLSNGTAYALTNHHVVRNDDLDKCEYSKCMSLDFADSFDTVLINKQGDLSAPSFLEPGYSEFDPKKHRFTCPSIQDHGSFIDNRKDRERYWLKMSHRPESTKQLASIRAQLQMVGAAESSFGAVHASSGLRTVRCEKFSSDPTTGKRVAETGKPRYRFLLDWSLLAPPSTRSMANSLDESLYEPTQISHIPQSPFFSNWTTMNNPKCNIMRDEVEVIKIGRTTGLTHGTVNAIPTIITPDMDGGQHKFMSDTYGLTVEECGHSMSFTSPEGAAVGTGDSGSIVLHTPSGHWLGLLFGEISTRAALFTPIDLVLRDIEEVTGHKVVEPAFIYKW
jgi:hypothetical protein